jgi:hypothetical protein
VSALTSAYNIADLRETAASIDRSVLHLGGEGTQ